MVSTSKPPQAQTAPSDLALVIGPCNAASQNTTRPSRRPPRPARHELGVYPNAVDEAGSRATIWARSTPTRFSRAAGAADRDHPRLQSYKNLGKLLERQGRSPKRRKTGRALRDPACFASATRVRRGGADAARKRRRRYARRCLAVAGARAVRRRPSTRLRYRALLRARLAHIRLKQLLLIDMRAALGRRRTVTPYKRSRRPSSSAAPP